VTHSQRYCLLTATPRNKGALDIYHQIKLFHPEDQTDLPIDPPNLKEYFKLVEAGKKQLPALLSHILIRRTRNHILRFYGIDGETNLPVDPTNFAPYLEGKKRAYVKVGGKNRFFPKRELSTIEYSIEDTYQGLYDRLRQYLGRADRQPGSLPIDELCYARYGLGNYVLPDKQQQEPYRSLQNAGMSLKGLMADELEKASNTYDLADFDQDLLYQHIQADLNIFIEIFNLVEPITPDRDAKLQTLRQHLATPLLRDKKRLIFTQYYDLHWNPVKLIQRFGRIDRIGSEKDVIYGLNFLPELNLERNLRLQQVLKRRIQEIHDSIGEDSAILDRSEELNENAMYAIYEHKAENIEELNPTDAEMEFLDINEAEEMIRRLQKDDPGEFDRIKNLPNGIRSAKLDSKSGTFIFVKLQIPTNHTKKAINSYF
jgi:hypothetical protein